MAKIIKVFIVLIVALILQSFTITANHASSKQTVYICVTGKVYHATIKCRSLRNATHQIKEVPLSEAQKSRRACKICY